MADRRHWWILLLGLTRVRRPRRRPGGHHPGRRARRGGCCPPVLTPPPPGWAAPALPQSTSPGEVKPATPTPTPETPPNLQLGSELQGTAETASVALSGPNMFGDAFGTRGARLLFALPFGGTLVPRVASDQFTGTVSPVLPSKQYGPGAVIFTNTNGFAVQGLTFSTLAFTNSGTVTFPVASGSVALNNQPALEQALIAQAQKQFGPGVQLVNGSSIATLIPPGTVTIGSTASEQAILTQSPFLMTVLYTAEGQLVIPTPTGGGAVGRTKISDDNSPLPHDRIIFDYDFFDNVPLTNHGVNVNRFSAGIEKTFLNGQMSLEIRVPFAATLSDDISTNGAGSSDNVELGDLNFTFKALFYHSQTLALAAGLGIAVPTAPDVRVTDAFGDELVRVRDQAVILTPYFCYLLTPTDRLFFQNWVEFGFDANGNPVNANLTLAGPQDIGKLRDQTLCQVDAQLGYWLIRADDTASLIRGLAPFLELHYNATLGSPGQVQAPGFTLVSDQGHVDELNLTAGFLTAIGDNLELGLGVVVPLRGDNDRTFDWQIGIHGNYFFGPSAGDTSRYGRVTSF